MRFKRLRLWRLSGKAYNFLWYREFSGKAYNELQRTEIWARAKEILITKRTRNNRKMLRCTFCKKPIKYKQTIVMHHKVYEWNHLFTPRFVQFVHYNCHRSLHARR